MYMHLLSIISMTYTLAAGLCLTFLLKHIQIKEVDTIVCPNNVLVEKSGLVKDTRRSENTTEPADRRSTQERQLSPEGFTAVLHS